MKEGELIPDTFTFVAVLKACACLGALEEGNRVHAQIIECGCESDVFVGSSLIQMYVKCGVIEDASRVFDKMSSKDVVIWTAMINGYVKCGQGQKALELYKQMQVESVKPDSTTFLGVLNACASVGELDKGRRVHEHLIQSGRAFDPFVGSSLVDMYTKCGSIEDAQEVFTRMPDPDLVSYNAMILGYVKSGQGQKALELSRQMELKSVKPNSFTFVAVLNACASVAAVEEGRRVHGQMIASGCEINPFVGSSLVDMYAKCGCIKDARNVFNKMPTRDVVSWNTMLGGYAMHGLAEEAVRLFEEMSRQAVKVNRVTFLGLLSACSHAGFVEEGLHYFESMTAGYGIFGAVEHYACLVDLLGRAGRLNEAQDVIRTMPYEPNVAVWKALLGACRVHGNADIGETIAKQVIELDPQSSSGYVMLSNIYAENGKWEEKSSIQKLRIDNGVKKQPGRTWIDVNNELHSFVVDDQEHPRINDIHAELQRLSEEMKEAGYVPDTRFVLHDVEEEEKLERLCYHSEKLAIAFGLLSTPADTPVRIFKNLRVCGDCHTAAKIISRTTGREIVMRDVNRFHHVKGGVCSCMDYW